MTMPRVEVITSVERRRRWSREEKERLVVASFAPGVSVSEVARSAGIHVSQLFRWRKDLCDRVDAGSSGLVPVEIVPATTIPPAVEAPAPSASSGRRRRKSGIIEIELGGGRRVRVDSDVDAEAFGAFWTRSGPDDSGSERSAGVAGDRPYRHEEGLPGPGAGGAGDAEA